MGSVPVLKHAEVCRLGFNAVRQRGSHIQYRHPNGRGATVPMHKGRDIAPSLLRQVARDIGLTIEELPQNR
jgi:predicted RNA binding protein YcfA (HicA-like mRNA interferase family)